MIDWLVDEEDDRTNEKRVVGLKDGGGGRRRLGLPANGEIQTKEPRQLELLE